MDLQNITCKQFYDWGLGNLLVNINRNVNNFATLHSSQFEKPTWSIPAHTMGSILYSTECQRVTVISDQSRLSHVQRSSPESFFLCDVDCQFTSTVTWPPLKRWCRVPLLSEGEYVSAPTNPSFHDTHSDRWLRQTTSINWANQKWRYSVCLGDVGYFFFTFPEIPGI